MNEYSKGLAHGYEDAYWAVRETLELDVSDAEKLRLITAQVQETPVTEHVGQFITEYGKVEK